MNKHIVKYLLLSDIHLGHDINKTTNIINNLDRFFIKYKRDIDNVDMIIISGDVFDRLLSNANKDSILAYSWLSRLVQYCSMNNIKLRILEGTPSHDRKQVKQLTEIIKSLGLEDKVDYKYFEELDVEYIEDLGLWFLYIPDEWKHKASEVLEDVKKKLEENDLDKVDVIVMHGAFKYQIPHIQSESFHDQDEYVKLARYTINCGHVHNRSQYENILVPGSFDRLTFADEGDIKGGLLVYLNSDGTFDYKVLENTNALYFKTFDLDKTSWDAIEKELEKLNKKLDKGHIRFIVNDRSALSQNLIELKEKYPNLKFKVEKKSNQNLKEKELDLEKTTEIELTKLDSETIEQYVKENISPDVDKNMLEAELKNIL